MCRIVLCSNNGKIYLLSKSIIANIPFPGQCDVILSIENTSVERIANDTFDIIIISDDCINENFDDVVAHVRENNRTAEIILISPEIKYAISGYKSNVFRYVIYDDAFSQNYSEALKSAILKINRDKLSFPIVSAKSTKSYPLADVYYIESSNRLIYIHTKNGIESTRASLSSLSEQLKMYGFVRCHKSFIVNRLAIKTIHTTTVELCDGSIIPIGRVYKDSINNG